MTNPYRQLPSIDHLISHPTLSEAILSFGRTSVRDAARQLLADTREAIGEGINPPDEDTLASTLMQVLHDTLSPSLYPVINATGVIIHTNLGRAPLSQTAQEAMVAVAQGYSNLEYELTQGGRGSRYRHAEQLLCELTGAEAALVVNNNAAAILLLLRSVAVEKEVIVSRGELVEIGGGFRIPDILRQSGAYLVEVGTTNRTRTSDYVEAVSERTAAMLKIHQSNFKMIGFTESAPLEELVEFAQSQSTPLPVLNDLGSGTLLDTRPYGLAYEPTVQDSVEAGCDATTFSGDKLLGGPQAGIIVGNKDLIAKLKRQPLTRALRVDKTTLAALQATLLAYLRGTATNDIPVWQMMSAEPEILAQRAQKWADRLTQAGIPVELRPGLSAVGGGSLPGQTLPTMLLALLTERADYIATKLRTQDTPVVARIEEDTLVLDPRTVLADQEVILLRSIESVWE